MIVGYTSENSLNAPFGARCFMTQLPTRRGSRPIDQCLNAPFGARCFMTGSMQRHRERHRHVLMHRLALGAL